MFCKGGYKIGPLPVKIGMEAYYYGRIIFITTGSCDSSLYRFFLLRTGREIRCFKKVALLLGLLLIRESHIVASRTS